MTTAISRVRAATRGLPLARLLAPAFFLLFLAVYVRTAAPSVLSGDSAEFQLAAPLLGVPHPTTYPLFTLLGKLATLLVPFGDLAWRVTLVSATAGALAVGLFFALARRATGSDGAAALAALALGVTPGLWNAASIAEVYALLAALMAALGLVLLSRPVSGWRLALAGLVAGLGFSHHGLFALTALPIFAVWSLLRLAEAWRGAGVGGAARTAGLLAFGFALGLTPWIYPMVQYARFGPFLNTDEYGLPRHYFWGAPTSWGEAFGMLLGGSIGRSIFRLPAGPDVLRTLSMVGQRLLFEFGPLGVPLGILGWLALARRTRALWLASTWVLVATLAYVLLLGASVQDAPVFTLPLLLPWALWIGCGGLGLAGWMRQRARWRQITQSTLAVLLILTLAWGYSRVPFSSKRHLWLYREFGQATLQSLPPDAVVIVHWEQGMTLQYLKMVEGRRPDIWIDVVEPGDHPWAPRAARYAGRPVFFVGVPEDVAGLPVELVREDVYADLFRLTH